MKRQIIFLATVCAVACSISFAGPPKLPGPGVALTIYNENFGVVRESRQMSFEKGINTKKFTDVASAIDPTSVNFRCLSAPGAVSIFEQNYEYDLVNADSLLNRYIDKNVTVVLKGSGADTGKELTGLLLAALNDNLILQSQVGGIEILDKNSIEEISLKELPDDLATRPTLVWLANAKEAGSQLCQVTYIAERIGWNADYSAVLNADETKIDFTGWVTIDNKSGATYKDSVIKLIAGDVRRIVEPKLRRGEMLYADKGVAEVRFEEKPFMEYHLYTLGRRSTINNNQAKQIEFIEPALGVPTKKLYIYERKPERFYQRSRQLDKVQVKFEFENTEENGLGIALPKGKIRVFKKDPADDMLEFVGEDEIDHTAKKEKLSLYIGDAFDVVPKYTLLDSKRGWFRRQTEKHKIELQNRKDEAVTVFVDEKFPARVNWKIDESTHKYEKRDARTARFEVRIDADSTVTIEYTATQTW